MISWDECMQPWCCHVYSWHIFEISTVATVTVKNQGECQTVAVGGCVDVSLGVRRLSRESPWAPISLNFRLVDVMAGFYSPSVPKLSLLLPFLRSYEKEIASKDPSKSGSGIFISMKDVSPESVLVFLPLEDFLAKWSLHFNFPLTGRRWEISLLSCSYLSSTFLGSIAIQLAGDIHGGVLEKRLISKKRNFHPESRRIYTHICGGLGE